MNQNNFNLGNENESIVKDKFIKEIEKKGFTINHVEKAPNEKFYDWDYKINFGVNGKSRDVKIEIKVDTLMYETDNFYIEYMNTTQNEPSGIYASKADYLVYHDYKQDITYVININNLKSFIDEQKRFLIDIDNQVTGDSNARGYIIYKPFLIKHNIINETF